MALDDIFALPDWAAFDAWGKARGGERWADGQGWNAFDNKDEWNNLNALFNPYRQAMGGGDPRKGQFGLTPNVGPDQLAALYAPAQQGVKDLVSRVQSEHEARLRQLYSQFQAETAAPVSEPERLAAARAGAMAKPRPKNAMRGIMLAR